MKTFRAILGVAVLAALANYAWAGSGGCDCEHGGPVVCPNCHCELKHKVVKEKKYCWNVECKAICIPKIKFPWEDCCAPPKCAKMKYVNVLKKHEYECEACKYKWEAVCDKCGACADKAAPTPASSDQSTPPSPVTIHSPGDYYGRSIPNFAAPPVPVGLDTRGVNFQRPPSRN